MVGKQGQPRLNRSDLSGNQSEFRKTPLLF